MVETTTIGLDVAKRFFQVHGVSADGKVTIKRQLRRSELLGFFGGPADFESLRLDATSSDHILANAADEALLRLEDPLHLPDNWSSLRS